MNGLHGKAAILTGAGSGIGRATAVRFADEGVSVLVTDMDGEAAAAAANAIRETGGCAEAASVDVADAAKVASMVSLAVERFGRLDIVVANAGVMTSPSTVVELAPGEWERLWAVNLTGAFLCAKQAIAQMRRQRSGGVLLFTSSGAALSGTPGQLAYGASKAALVHMVKTMALDHGREGIRVNCVCPGPTSTPAMRREMDEGAIRTLAAAIPLGARLARADEIAAAFAFLASDDASFISGQALAVDGAFSAGGAFPVRNPVTGPNGVAEA